MRYIVSALFILALLYVFVFGWGGPDYPTNYADHGGATMGDGYYETVNRWFPITVFDLGVPGVKCQIGFLERYYRSVRPVVNSVPRTISVDSGRCTGLIKRP